MYGAKNYPIYYNHNYDNTHDSFKTSCFCSLHGCIAAYEYIMQKGFVCFLNSFLHVTPNCGT